MVLVKNRHGSFERRPFSSNTALPVAPLVSYLERRWGYGNPSGLGQFQEGHLEQWGGACGLSREAMKNMLYRGTIAIRTADRICCELGIHLSYLWPEAVEVVELDESDLEDMAC